jgi:hypothetical protein
MSVERLEQMRITGTQAFRLQLLDVMHREDEDRQH